MEHLFSPSTRYRDLLESQGRRLEEFNGPHPELLRELNLDVTTEELLSVERAFAYADMYAMLENEDTVAWLTPHASVVCANGRGLLWSSFLDDDYTFRVNVDGKCIRALAHSSEAHPEIFDVFRRLLLADVSEIYELEFKNEFQSGEVVFFNAPSFADLVEQCQSLKALILEQISLTEDLLRVLGDLSRPGLEIKLKHCRIADATGAELAQILGRNRGPTKIDLCEIDNFVLANGLRGNSRLKSLNPRISSSPEDGNREVLAIADALRENKGLVDLDLKHQSGMSYETWDAVCDSLKTHPTLKVLNLWSMEPFGGAPSDPAVLKSRIQALANMLKVNMSLHTIRLPSGYSEHELFRGSVIPYLETNRVRAIQKAHPIAYRTKVLGRALLASRTDANSFWMLLSGNAEVAFPPTTATTTLATNLTTPATAAATSNAAAITATAVVSVTTTRDPSATGASAAANVDTPTAGQK
jgi:hypothetical protein